MSEALFDMPREKIPASSPPPNGENGEPLPAIDIAQLTTGLLFSPTSRSTPLEEMATAHDRDVKRLTAWRTQVRRWLDAARPAFQAPMRRLRWLRNERKLSTLETHEAARLAQWLDGVMAQIAEPEEPDLARRHRMAIAPFWRSPFA